MNEENNELIKEDIVCMIENNLCKSIKTTIEGEFNIDKMGNLVYKDGGRNRVASKIKTILQDGVKEYNINQGDIIDILKKSISQISTNSQQEGNEILDILEEIEIEEKVKKDIEEGNIEKYERDM